MIEEILNTEVKARIMKLFSEFPESQFQPVQIARMTELSLSRTNESLKELAGMGILKSRKVSRSYLFGANKSNYVTKIILDAFRKERGFVDFVVREFVSGVKRLGRIENITLFGSALKELKIGSDIDLLMVFGEDIDTIALSKIASELTVKYGFRISLVFMTPEELKRKTRENFVTRVMAEGRTVFGKDLEEIAYGKGNQG
jgi:predicted nucleotidyltransferase